MTNEDLVYCYNKGCKHKKFDPKNNPENSVECEYHPGAPIFHDAMKIWSCCNKKSHDFTEFLDIKGCKRGPHNPVKPEPPKPAQTSQGAPVEIGQPIVKAAERQPAHSVEARLIELPVTVAPSLKDSLAKLAAQISESEDGKSGENVSTVIEKGAPCKNRGCTERYGDDDASVDAVELIEGEDDEPHEEESERQKHACIYHPGVPVFHEGMKFWSCCQRKTADFDVFLNQEGCEVGEHFWLKKGERLVKPNSCRSDFHQTTTLLSLNFYAKLCDPSKSKIRASGTEVDVHIEYDGGHSVLDRRLQLFGSIDPSKSTVKIGAKVELLLVKLEKIAWPRLEYVPPVTSSTED